MGDIVKFGGQQPIEALAIHAVREIEAGEELTVYYGDEYARDYPVGLPPAKRLSKGGISAWREIPKMTLGEGQASLDGIDLWRPR